jgi:hypothetical protein
VTLSAIFEGVDQDLETRIKRLRDVSRPKFRLRMRDVRVFCDLVDAEVHVLAIASKGIGRSLTIPIRRFVKMSRPGLRSWQGCPNWAINILDSRA